MHGKQNPPWLPERKDQLSGGRLLTLTDRPSISSVRRDPSRKKFFLKRSDPSQCKALESSSYHVVRASWGCVSVYQDQADLLLHFAVLASERILPSSARSSGKNLSNTIQQRGKAHDLDSHHFDPFGWWRRILRRPRLGLLRRRRVGSHSCHRSPLSAFRASSRSLIRFHP